MKNDLIHYFEYFFENDNFHNRCLRCSRVCVGFSKLIDIAIDTRVQLMSIAMSRLSTRSECQLGRLENEIKAIYRFHHTDLLKAKQSVLRVLLYIVYKTDFVFGFCFVFF